jgi:hypothetical protein
MRTSALFVLMLACGSSSSKKDDDRVDRTDRRTDRADPWGDRDDRRAADRARPPSMLPPCPTKDFDVNSFVDLYAQEAALDDGAIDCATLSKRVLAWRDEHGTQLMTGLLCFADSAIRNMGSGTIDLTLLGVVERADRSAARIKAARARCPDAPFIK